MRVILLALILLMTINSWSQGISINTVDAPPDPSAILDVQSISKGVLIPRMTLEQRDMIAFPATGLLIHQLDGLTGLYIFTGTGWLRLPNELETWSTTGNIGTNPNSQFFGTLDNQPIRFRLNNTWAGELNRTSGNALIGDSSGMVITSAHSNTAFGHRTLASLTTGNRNVAIGYSALRSLQTGGHNIGIGYHALLNATTGDQNIAIGSYALEKNTTGALNLCVGSFSMTQNTSAVGNTVLGHFALPTSTTGSYNTAVGLDVMSDNSIGHSNTVLGAAALFSNTTGHNNLALGRQSLNTNSTGEYNIALGTTALSNNTTGDYNLAIGFGTGTQTGNLYNTVSISNNGSLHTLDNRIYIGNVAHTWTGGNVTWSTYSDARIKCDVMEDVVGLDFIKRLRPVTYHRDIDAQTSLTGNKPLHDFPKKYDIEQIRFSGFLAQEVATAAVESGYDFSGLGMPAASNDLYTLSYESFVVPLVKAVQEQQVLIEEQRKLIAEQGEMLKSLQAVIEERVVHKK